MLEAYGFGCAKIKINLVLKGLMGFLLKFMKWDSTFEAEDISKNTTQYSLS